MSSDTDLNVEIPQINVEKITSSVQSIGNKIYDSFLSIDFWIPTLIIVTALAIGWIVRIFIRPKMIAGIDRLNLTFRTNVILKNITKLIMSVVALLTLALAEAVLSNIQTSIDPTILEGASKLLVAWILIRLIAQIIENSFVRQVVAMCGWIIAALSILGLLDQTKTALVALGMDFGEFRLSLLTVLKFVIAIFILLTMTRLVTNAAERSLRRATDLTPSARVLLIKVIKITLVALAILIGVTTAGIDLSALAIFGGALGLGIGFGLQKVISNLFSGMLLLIDKSIKPGDIIEMRDNSGVFGWVNQLGARYVSIITRDNKEYLIPNEDFITQPVINWSYTDKKIRVETKFGVDYNSDPHFIKKLGVEVASKVNRVCEDPKPVCHLVEFDDSSLNFALRYWIEDAENGVTNTKGDVMLGLWDAFKEHGIEIPFPHRVLIEKKKK